ncbi:MAG: hypothetical protein AB7O32_05475 [Vicinamibacterales bacterium]
MRSFVSLAGLACAAWLAGTAPALAQDTRTTPSAPTDPPARPDTLGFSFDADYLRDLPLSDSLFSLFENVQPSLISDRFTGGGLYTGQPARVGGFQASWTQTRYLIGDVDLSDPTGSGMPLVVPDLSPWQRVRVATGLLGSDVNATGLAVSLDPVMPAGGSRRWRSTGFASTSHGGMTGRESPLSEPTIARLTGRDRAMWMSAGPLGDQLSAMVSGSWTRADQVDRDTADAVRAEIGTATGSVYYTTAGGAQVQTVGMAHRSRVPFELRLPYGTPAARTDETAAHLQTTLVAPPDRAWPWRAFVAYTQRTRTPDSTGNLATLERMIDGPVSSLADVSRGTVRQWTAGARTRGVRLVNGRSHVLSAGVDAVGARHRVPAADEAIRSVAEATDGQPSRVWRVTDPGIDSVRRNLLLSAHVADAVQLTTRLRVSAGLRFESVTGSAEDAVDDVSWLSLLPRARLDWRLHEGGSTTFFTGYSRTAYRLPLDLLAFGDPAAPTADIYRWRTVNDPQSALNGPVIARVGPGTGGRADFVRIDPELSRPVSDELAFGFEIVPGARSRYQIAMIGRRESGFIGLTNLDAPLSAYTVTRIDDPGANTGSPDDDKVIPIYARIASTFGGDRYLLTNTGAQASLSGSLELSGQWTSSRLTVYGGATASIARGPAANIGYGPYENDQSALPDTWVSPNQLTFSRGRLFNDRAFTVKLNGVYRLPWNVRVGAIARYQDGQTFSRVLVFPDLPQGAEAIRAFPAGDSRFRFIGTLDLRVSKTFRVGGTSVDAVLDGYNVPNMTYDVEERAGQAPNVRTPIAIQPSRAWHAGLRVSF